MIRWRRGILPLGLGLVACGCTPAPSAPILSQDPAAIEARLRALTADLSFAIQDCYAAGGHGVLLAVQTSSQDPQHVWWQGSCSPGAK